MKSKKKKKKIIIIISSIVCVPILIIALILTIRCIVHFPACPKWVIRQYFVWNTPIGSAYDEVHTFLNNCGKCEYIVTNEDYGIVVNTSNLSTDIYFANERHNLRDYLQSHPWLKVIGAKAIEVNVGGCDFPLPHIVYAYFAFDEEGKLIKVYVEKENGWP